MTALSKSMRQPALAIGRTAICHRHFDTLSVILP
jgi:hypothetical protein